VTPSRDVASRKKLVDLVKTIERERSDYWEEERDTELWDEFATDISDMGPWTVV
jgi:hypothetical protein